MGGKEKLIIISLCELIDLKNLIIIHKLSTINDQDSSGSLFVIFKFYLFIFGNLITLVVPML